MVTGPLGIAAGIDAYADIDCNSARNNFPQYPDCSLNVDDWAAAAQWRSEAALWFAEAFTGALWADNQSKLWLRGAEQQYDGPRLSQIRDTSELKVQSARRGGDLVQAALDGQTGLFGFSRALLLIEARLDGVLNCNDAADAWADPGVTYSEGSSVSGCEHLPEPAP